MLNNKINYKYFSKQECESEEQIVIYSNRYNENISLIKNNQSFTFDYFGFKLIKCSNTNKAIRELMFNDFLNSNIKINDVYLRQKDVIIISPFTKLSDVISKKVNGNIHNYLKSKNLILINSNIEKFIVEKLNDFDDELKEVINYDLSKCDLINYIDIKDEFIDEKNIIHLLNILKTFDKKILIIFNDVDYLKFDILANYFQFFNFIYFVNGFEETYKNIENYEDYLVDYDFI